MAYLYSEVFMDDDVNAFDLPETTREEIITKIECLACQICGDWTDPRGECRAIVELCGKLRPMLA